VDPIVLSSHAPELERRIQNLYWSVNSNCSIWWWEWRPVPM
jgi:hypothetical protein